QAVGESGRGRLVDDAYYFHSRNFASLLGGLALRIVEVSWDGNDDFADLFTEEVLRGVLQFGENHRGDFWRAVLLAGDLDARVVVRPLHDFIRHALGLILHFVIAASHKPLDRIHRVFGIGD